MSGMYHWKTSAISKIVQEKSHVTYTWRHIMRMAHERDYSLITPRKKHRNSASPEKAEEFKKKEKRYWVLSKRK